MLPVCCLIQTSRGVKYKSRGAEVAQQRHKLENIKEGINFWTFKFIFTSFTAFSSDT